MVERIPNGEEEGKWLWDKVFLNEARGRTLDVLSIKEDVKKRIELWKIMERLEALYDELYDDEEVRPVREEWEGEGNDKEIREEIWALEEKLAGYKSLFNAEIVKKLFDIGCKGFVANEVINNNDLNGYLPLDEEWNEYEWRLDEDLAVSLMKSWYSGLVIKKNELFGIPLPVMLDKLIELKQFSVIMDCIEYFPDHQDVVCKIIKNWWWDSVGPRLSKCNDLDIVKVVELMIMEGGVSVRDVERYANDYIASLEKKDN